MGSELYVVVAACAMYTLKKQVGCFNHRVVTLVAILVGYTRFLLVFETNCTRQPERQLL